MTKNPEVPELLRRYKISGKRYLPLPPPNASKGITRVGKGVISRTRRAKDVSEPWTKQCEGSRKVRSHFGVALKRGLIPDTNLWRRKLRKKKIVRITRYGKKIQGQCLLFLSPHDMLFSLSNQCGWIFIRCFFEFSYAVSFTRSLLKSIIIIIISRW